MHCAYHDKALEYIAKRLYLTGEEQERKEREGKNGKRDLNTPQCRHLPSPTTITRVCLYTTMPSKMDPIYKGTALKCYTASRSSARVSSVGGSAVEKVLLKR